MGSNTSSSRDLTLPGAHHPPDDPLQSEAIIAAPKPHKSEALAAQALGDGQQMGNRLPNPAVVGSDVVVLPVIVDMVRKWAGEAGDMMDEGLYGVRFQFKRADGGLAGTLSHGPKGAVVYMPGEKPLPVDEWLEKWGA